MSHSPLPSRVWCHHPLSFDPTRSRVESSRLSPSCQRHLLTHSVHCPPPHRCSHLMPIEDLHDTPTLPHRHTKSTSPHHTTSEPPNAELSTTRSRSCLKVCQICPVCDQSRGSIMCAGWVVTVQLPLPQQTNPTAHHVLSQPTQLAHSPTPRPNLTSLLCF